MTALVSERVAAASQRILEAVKGLSLVEALQAVTVAMNVLTFRKGQQ